MEIKGFIGKHEDTVYYTNGVDVFRAPETNTVDCTTGYLIGRWECSLSHFNLFKDSVYSFLEDK